MDEHIADLTAFMEPPRWRVFAHRKWKRRGKEQATLAMQAAMRGEYEPLRAIGIDASARGLDRKRAK